MSRGQFIWERLQAARSGHVGEWEELAVLGPDMGRQVRGAVARIAAHALAGHAADATEELAASRRDLIRFAQRSGFDLDEPLDDGLELGEARVGPRVVSEAGEEPKARPVADRRAVAAALDGEFPGAVPQSTLTDAMSGHHSDPSGSFITKQAKYSAPVDVWETALRGSDYVLNATEDRH